MGPLLLPDQDRQAAHPVRAAMISPFSVRMSRVREPWIILSVENAVTRLSSG